MNQKASITISDTDAVRLEALLASPSVSNFPGKAALEEELSRAEIVDSHEMPPEVVTMNSTVKFNVSSSDSEFCLTLVYPKDMKDDGTTISILAPVGSALLGLSTGDEIEWPCPSGGLMQVNITEVLYQPERAGEFHR